VIFLGVNPSFLLTGRHNSEKVAFRVKNLGYTHYWYREKEIDQETFDKIRGDFEKFLPLFKALDIKLADGVGKGEPLLTKDEIIFNGSAHCGHTRRDFAIAWPATQIKNGVAPNSERAKVGSWFAGVLLNQRACDGDCSHETFLFPRVLELRDWQKPQDTGKERGKYFQFTKTAFKPYDLAVNIALIIAKHHLRDRIIVKSDGKWQHWKDAFIIVKNVLSYVDFQLDEDA